MFQKVQHTLQSKYGTSAVLQKSTKQARSHQSEETTVVRYGDSQKIIIQ